MLAHPTMRRVAPIGACAALAGAAAVVAHNDPAAAGSHFPGCPFHAVTGLWCPGCGLTRASHALLTGHPLTAVGQNVFLPLVVVAMTWSMVSWLRTSWGATPLVVPTPMRTLLGRALPVLLIVYGVARNLPVAPLRALAP